MPLPSPHSGESEKDFIGRCIGAIHDDPTYKAEGQPAAVCYSQWRKAHGEKKGLEVSFNGMMQLRKLDEHDRIIAGYASVPVIDTEGDLITLDALRSAWESFIASEYPILSVAHEDIPLGTVLSEYTDKYGTIHKSGVDDRGLYVIGKLRADNKIANEIWQQIQSWGGRGAFSIRAGVLQNPQFAHMDDGTYYSQYGPNSIELHAIGVGREGVNAESSFMILKAKKPSPRKVLHLQKAPGILEVN